MQFKGMISAAFAALQSFVILLASDASHDKDKRNSMIAATSLEDTVLKDISRDSISRFGSIINKKTPRSSESSEEMVEEKREDKTHGFRSESIENKENHDAIVGINKKFISSQDKIDIGVLKPRSSRQDQAKRQASYVRFRTPEEPKLFHQERNTIASMIHCLFKGKHRAEEITIIPITDTFSVPYFPSKYFVVIIF